MDDMYELHDIALHSDKDRQPQSFKDRLTTYRDSGPLLYRPTLLCCMHLHHTRRATPTRISMDELDVADDAHLRHMYDDMYGDT